MTEPDVVKSLEELGFNLNEGRAYASLLARGASTGYEVAQHAGIPRSAVYSVLRKLVAQGAARRTAGPPERFSATPPQVVLSQLKKRFDASADGLREAVARLEVASNVPDVYGVEGYERILEEATALVQGAKKTLVLSGWPREIERLASEIARAEGRGVFVVVFSHGALPDSVVGTRFSYGVSEKDLESFWQHRLVVVADDTRCLLGATARHPGDRAVVSSTAAIAEIAVSQVSLDVTLLAQRHDRDVGGVLAKMLGDRVGRLDSLLSGPAQAEVGRTVSTGKSASKSKPPRARRGTAGRSS
ncbi:MAG: TrmB family transcriptional regulator [Myxococcales bacterium]|nr:TrmB family transcriptional regulator [Myxococcales bacterium]